MCFPPHPLDLITDEVKAKRMCFVTSQFSPVSKAVQGRLQSRYGKGSKSLKSGLSIRERAAVGWRVQVEGYQMEGEI